METYEAGIVLTGTEVCSLRENNCQLTDCFALVRNGEVWLHNLHIAPYSHGNIANPDPDRVRKLLLHRNQIRDLVRKTQEKGMALVPLKIYFCLLYTSMAVSRGFDDKMGVYIAVRVLEELAKAGGAPGDYICAATVQEAVSYTHLNTRCVH